MKKKKKALLLTLLFVVLALILVLDGRLFLSEFVWTAGGFRSRSAQQLDLRGKSITVSEYEEAAQKLPGCRIVWDVPLQSGSWASDSREVRVSGLSDADLEMLSYFTDLTLLSAGECSNYAALSAFQARNPGCRVEYLVRIGGERFSSTAQSVTVTDPDPEELADKLPLLPEVRTAELTGTLPAGSELKKLMDTFPEIQFHWQTEFEGRMLDSTTEELNVSGKSRSREELAQLAAALPGLKKMDVRGCGLSGEELAQLASEFPACFFLGTVQVAGESFSTDVEEMDLTGIVLNQPEDVEQYLHCFPNLKKVILSGCGLDSETLDAMNRRHEDVRIVWTVQLGKLAVRTDETWFMPIKYNVTVQTEDLYDLRYCTDMECIDIGHMWVHNCDWAAYMPNLQYLIIGETYITDLSPLEGLKKLKFLEIFTINVKDYTPLLGCTGMEDLNLGLTYGSPDVIAQMTWLKNLWWCDANGVHDPARREAVTRMCEELSDTTIKIYIEHPTASGWRKLPNYYAMRDMMGMFYLP